jgi:hypothetical protein
MLEYNSNPAGKRISNDKSFKILNVPEKTSYKDIREVLTPILNGQPFFINDQRTDEMDVLITVVTAEN